MATKKEPVWGFKRIAILVVIGVATIAMVGATVAPAIIQSAQNDQQAAQQEVQIQTVWRLDRPITKVIEPTKICKTNWQNHKVTKNRYQSGYWRSC